MSTKAKVAVKRNAGGKGLVEARLPGTRTYASFHAPEAAHFVRY